MPRHPDGLLPDYARAPGTQYDDKGYPAGTEDGEPYKRSEATKMEPPEPREFPRSQPEGVDRDGA